MSRILRHVDANHGVVIVKAFTFDVLPTLSYFPVPSNVVWISSTQTVEVGSTATLGCVVIGKPSPLVVWKKDGEILFSSTLNGNLTLGNISLADMGVYECLAINNVGNDSRKTILNVVGTYTQLYYSTYYILTF